MPTSTTRKEIEGKKTILPLIYFEAYVILSPQNIHKLYIYKKKKNTLIGQSCKSINLDFKKRNSTLMLLSLSLLFTIYQRKENGL